MENLVDLIIPLIFIATFLLNGLFKPKKKQGDPEEAAEGETEAPAADPLAELREEIRRRIEANQRGTSATEESSPAQAPQAQPAVPSPSMRNEPAPVPAPQARSYDPVSEFDAQSRQAAERMRKMQQMQDQVRVLQQRAAEERSKVQSVRSGDAWKRKDASTRSQRRYQRSALIREVIEELQEPGSSRKAVLNAEILGTPVGLRRPAQSQSLWGG